MTPANEEKLEQLERLLNSRALHGSESLRAFLKFVVMRSVEDHDGQLKEYTIATEVFGRGANYDSRSDSTVRVQAGRLRAKLLEYYASEGKSDRILIDLPKGQYHPHFSYTEEGKPEHSNGERARSNGVLTQVAEATTAAAAPADKRLRFLITIAVILCVVLGALAIVNVLGLVRPKEASSNREDRSAEEVQTAKPLWSDFFRSTDPVLVSFSNSRFEGTAETGMRILKPMSTAPADQAPTDREPTRVVTEHYTGVGEVMGVYALGEFFYKAGHSMKLKRSLLLTWDDLKNNDIVVLGSPAENYLLRDLPQQQDFVFRMTKDGNDISAFGVINTKPSKDEQGAYFAKQEGPSRSQISEDYAVISLLRGLDQNHRLLILAGITTFGTQAAAEYVTKAEHISELISRLNTAPAGQLPRLPPYFQLLVKVKVNDGVPVQISYVTHHVL